HAASSSTSTLSLHDALPILYGGVNTLCYVPCAADQVCLDRMEITLCCVIPQSFTPTITCPPTLSRTCTSWNTNTISRTRTFTITDRKSTRLNSSHGSISYAV